MKRFCKNYDVKPLIKEATCFKNPENPTCVVLILTNKSRSFSKTGVTESGLSGFHKSIFQNLNHASLVIRSYKNIENKIFKEKVKVGI